MRLRNTVILGLLCLALGAYLYFVEFERAAKEGEKKSLLNFAQDDATAVTLTYPDREIVLEKTEDHWRLTAPVKAAADETTVDNLVRAIAEGEIKKRLEEAPETLEPFGLDAPAVVIKVKLRDRELPVIRVGKTTPVGYSAYLQLGDDPAIILGTSAFHAGMQKEVKDLRDKKILQFEDAEVRRISMHKPEGSAVLTRSDGQWRIEEPVTSAADQDVVRSFLSTLRSMRATDFPAEDPTDLSTYGLDAPRLEVTLHVGSDESPQTVLVGAETGDNAIYVKIASRPTVYTVGDWVFRDLDKGVNDFRDKTLLTFEEGDARKVEVRRGDGEAFTFSREAEATWSVAEAEGTPDTAKIDQFLSDLRDLKGYEIVDDQPEDLGAYGLAEPLLTIAVHGDGKTLGTIRLGSYSPEPPATEYTAVNEARPTVFHLREYLFKRVDKKLGDFLQKPTPTPTPTGN